MVYSEALRVRRAHRVAHDGCDIDLHCVEKPSDIVRKVAGTVSVGRAIGIAVTSLRITLLNDTVINLGQARLRIMPSGR